MECHYLGWDEPLLPKAAEWLLDQAPAGEALDLAAWLVVVPGSRASRRLQELLLAEAARRGSALDPPRILTVGALLPELAPPIAPAAPDLVRQIQWALALQATDPEELGVLLPEPCESWSAWLALARSLDRLALDLAASAADLGDAADAISNLLGSDREKARFDLLSRLQTEVQQALEAAGWSDPTRPSTTPLAPLPPVLLVGIPELPKTHRTVLEQIPAVEILVGAPPGEAARFDEWGCIRGDAWGDFALDLALEELILSEDPEMEGLALLKEIATLGPKIDPAKIRIGICDPELEAIFGEQLESLGISSHAAAGEALLHTAPLQLVHAFLGWIRNSDYRSLSDLLRHPDIQRPLREVLERSPADILDSLDKFAEAHRPGKIHAQSRIENGKAKDPLTPVLNALAELGGPLQGKARPLHEWSTPLLQFFGNFYGEQQVDRETPRGRRLWEVTDAWREGCREIAQLEGLPTPPLEGADALAILLELYSAARIPTLDPAESLELLGWLELALDDCPQLFLAGFQEGMVPEGRLGDAFLPDRLRKALGLPTEGDRASRDLFLLAQLRHARPRLPIFMARRSLEGSPLAPSRLIFQAPDEAVSARAEALYLQSPHGRPAALLQAGMTESNFRRVEAVDNDPVDSLSVTDFAAWLRDPYRFWLSRRLKLRAREDRPEELTAPLAGDLLHKSMELFAKDSAHAKLTDPKAVQTALESSFDAEALRRFGKHPLPVIRIQLEQLRRRLAPFAKWQAERATAGWEIVGAEISLPEGTHLHPLEDEEPVPLQLRGKVDRLDLHRASGKWAILDYKTGDKAAAVDKCRDKEGEWNDLQLPLYALHLTPPAGAKGDAELGYLRLSAALDAPTLSAATWTSEDLADAHRAAWDIATRIRAKEFPHPDRPPRYEDAFTWLCQDGQFVAPEEEAEA